MAQHLLLMTLAPPLILLGMPRKPLAHGLLQRFGASDHPLRSEPMPRLASVVTHPALCWFAAAGALIVWHIPSIFMLGLSSQHWHVIEQASFLATGLLFWWPVVQPWPRDSKWPESSILLYLFLATLPCDILSGFLVFCDRVGLPSVFVVSPLLWPLCPRRPAMRRCLDVDLRHCRLPNRRVSLHHAFTLAPSVRRTLHPAIRVAQNFGVARRVKEDGGGLKWQDRSSLREFSSTRGARAPFWAFHAALRLLVTHEARSELPDLDHNFRRVLYGFGKR